MYAKPYLRNMVSKAFFNHIMPEKSDFLHFACIRNEGVARGSRRGHRDLGPKINEMPSARLYWENRVSKRLNHSY